MKLTMKPPVNTPTKTPMKNPTKAPMQATLRSAAVQESRRAIFVRGVALLLTAPVLNSRPFPAFAENGGMRTSADFNTLYDLTGQQSQNLGAGTIAGKSRPVTGVVLLEEPAGSGDPKKPTISAEVVTNGGVAATVTFDSPWPLAKGMYYDVESRSADGDSAFLMVNGIPEGEPLALYNLMSLHIR